MDDFPTNQALERNRGLALVSREAKSWEVHGRFSPSPGSQLKTTVATGTARRVVIFRAGTYHRGTVLRASRTIATLYCLWRVSVFRLPVNHGYPMFGGYAARIPKSTDD